MQRVWLRICHSFEEEAEADREYWQQYSADERVARVDGAYESAQVERLAELRNAGVRTLIIGVHALAFHAKPRYTEALELLIDPASADVCDRLNTTPSERIHAQTTIGGMSFETAWNGRVEGIYADQRVFFIGKAELLCSKQASADLQDLADLDLLRRF